jgi:glutathione S-transferase
MERRRDGGGHEGDREAAILEKYLQGKTFLVAEQFSLADMCYVPFLEFLPLMEIVPPNAVEA